MGQRADGVGSGMAVGGQARLYMPRRRGSGGGRRLFVLKGSVEVGGVESAPPPHLVAYIIDDSSAGAARHPVPDRVGQTGVGRHSTPSSTQPSSAGSF